MTDDPYTTPPPSETFAVTGPTVQWWASLDYGRARRVSRLFDHQRAVFAWLHTEVREGEEGRIWKRTTNGATVEDEQVYPVPEEGVTRDHLHVAVRNLSEQLADKKKRRDLPSTGARGSGHVSRPDTTMDPLAVRMLAYDQVYDDNGQPRFDFDADGWPIIPKGKS